MSYFIQYVIWLIIKIKGLNVSKVIPIKLLHKANSPSQMLIKGFYYPKYKIGPDNINIAFAL